MNQVQITRHVYPVEPVGQQELIGLWRSEWSRTDYDSLEALNGDYADTLTIVSFVGRVENQPVATATVIFASDQPEVSLIGNVLTLASHRGRGIARTLTEAAVTNSFDAGCKVAYLGSARTEGNVYEQCGFERLAGCVMRRPAPGHTLSETEFFAADQPTEIRHAVWGDMPGLVSLLAQPLNTAVIDYPRCLLSVKFADPMRCVSAFPAVYDEVRQRDGVMLVLAAHNSGRIFGLATLTPGPAPGRAHNAMIDIAAHDHYQQAMDPMLDRLRQEAADRDIEMLTAGVAVTDTAKTDALSRAGLITISQRSGHLRFRSGAVDTLMMSTAPAS